MHSEIEIVKCFFIKPIDKQKKQCYNAVNKCDEQKPVGWKEPYRELPVGARQWGRPSRIRSVSSALNKMDLQQDATGVPVTEPGYGQYPTRSLP